MTAQDFDQPYMIYEGELPRHLRPKAARPRPQPQWRDVDEAEEADEADGFGGLSWFGMVVLAGVLALGVAIGVWGTLILRAPKAAPPPAAPVAFAATLAPTAPARPATPAPAPAAVTPQLAAMLQPTAAAPASAAAAPLRIARADGPASSAGPVAPSRPAHNCSSAGGRAEYAICADPELAAADLEMRRAYQRAVASGAPLKPLRTSQEDWLILSEVAADRSAAELARAYRTRIAELNALAVQDPPH